MNMINKFLLGLSFVMAATSVVAQQSNPYLEQLPKWGSVLNEYVDDQGRIDFVSLAQSTKDLEMFVSAIETVSPTSNPELFDTSSKVLSYHANAYNALAMWGVIDKGIPNNFSSLYKRAKFFKFRKVVIGGQKTDLYTYENKVIRPLGEARMHFVLNCMVKDCPRLPNKPFYENSFEQELQTAAAEFFNKEKHTQVDADKKELRLSGIMKFYTGDYVASGKKQDLLGYVNQFRDKQVPDEFKVEYLKYDWTINQQ